MPPVSARMRLRSRLGDLSLGDRVVEALARFLGVAGETGPMPGQGAGPDVDPSAAFLAFASALAQRRPMVIAIEDLHLADDATLSMVEQLDDADRPGGPGAGAHLASGTGGRGLGRHLGASRRYHHRLLEVDLGPMDVVASLELLGTVLPPILGPDERSALVTRAGGNPLYLEELARAVLEDGAPGGGAWTLSPAAADRVPTALEGLLRARLDRLAPDARAWLEAAAIVGRRFPVALVDVVAMPTGEHPIRELLRSEIVREERRFPVYECRFTHGLLHDAVLGGLSDRRRRDLHARAARALASATRDGEGSLAEMADHLARSTGTEKCASSSITVGLPRRNAPRERDATPTTLRNCGFE